MHQTKGRFYYRQFLSELLHAGNRYLLSFHENPDPDSVSSNIALAMFLQNQGKSVTLVWGLSGKVADLEYLSQGCGVIEKTVPEMDPNDYDALVLLDSATYDRVGITVEDVQKWKKVFVIDHHEGNTMNGSVTSLLEVSASSTCEILTNLFFGTDKRQVTTLIAKYLRLGIWTDTRGFRRRTSSATISLFARLSEIEPSMEFIDRAERSGKIENIEIIKNVIEAIEIRKVKGLKYAVVILPLSKLGGKKPSTHLATDFLEQFQEIDVACVVFEIGMERYRLSVRSYTVNASGRARQIAERFGGTGHADAAGALVDDRYPFIVDRLRLAIEAA